MNKEASFSVSSVIAGTLLLLLLVVLNVMLYKSNQVQKTPPSFAPDKVQTVPKPKNFLEASQQTRPDTSTALADTQSLASLPPEIPPPADVPKKKETQTTTKKPVPKTELVTKTDAATPLTKTAVAKPTPFKSKNGASKISYRNTQFTAYTVNVKQSELIFFLKNKAGKRLSSFQGLKDMLKGQGKNLAFATNGGMFHPTHEPVGLFVEAGKQRTPLNTKKESGNFYMSPNGVFCVTNDRRVIIKKTADYASIKNQAWYATQSGPMLIIDGKINPKFKEGSTNQYTRSGVGIINSAKAVFIISDTPVNFYDFALLFKEKYGCKNALYLDGAISKMYAPNLQANDLSGDFGVMIGVVE